MKKMCNVFTWFKLGHIAKKLGFIQKAKRLVKIPVGRWLAFA